VAGFLGRQSPKTQNPRLRRRLTPRPLPRVLERETCRRGRPGISSLPSTEGTLNERFPATQLFGLNGLVNLSNLVFLLAFSVRDVLKLRVLSVASYCLILPYYYLQSEPLWPPIFWGLAFIIVNGVRIVTLLLERRPVVLSDQEEQLYCLAFQSIDKREFLALVSFARWVDCTAGDVILVKGQQSTEVIVVISGGIKAISNGKAIVTFRPGQLIGNAYSGLPNPVDVVASGAARYIKWDRGNWIEFTESRPELRAKLLQIGSADLAAKLREAAGALFHAQ
jgi:Popeye protein conserved region